MATVAPIAAALVAVALSGAPRLIALHAPVEGHRCECRAHGGGHHECECATCRKAALAAQAADRRAPPCHRAAARAALSRAGPSRSRDVPCVEGTCGAGGARSTTLPGVEPFCVPARELATVVGAREARGLSTEPVRGRSPEPETPPPRAA